jgi:hypothetical protein
MNKVCVPVEVLAVCTLADANLSDLEIVFLFFPAMTLLSLTYCMWEEKEKTNPVDKRVTAAAA